MLDRRAVLGLAVVASCAAAAPAAAQEEPAIKAVYDRQCAQCHGVDGAGDGPAAAYMLPPPRDFTAGLYQIRTTPGGSLPTDDDLLRIIDEGMPGTAMPGWRDHLSSGQRRALVDYIKGFSRFFESEEVPPPVEIASAPGVTEEGLAEGREYFEVLECFRCHGDQGRGDGPSAWEQRDDAGAPTRPADLHKNWLFTGGGSAEDIFTRLYTGLDGTPMPSHADLIESEFITEEQLWRVSQYVRSLSPEEPPRVREVVRAALVEGELPTSPDDPAWDEADEFYFPLAGQIIIRPRWFAPSVSGVWVDALHNGEELALRLRWHDPTRSPNERWAGWREAVLAHMQPGEGPTTAEPLPDAFAVQFPRTIPEDVVLPHFLMGDQRNPVYLWHWRSDADGAVEALGRGLDRIEPLPDQNQILSSSAEHAGGRWQLVLRRTLESPDSANQLDFASGIAMPIAFFAWDGDNTEAGTRGAISSWYYLHLDESVPPTVYVTPAAAVLFTALMGVVVVVRAQRRERTAGTNDPPNSPHAGSQS